MKVRSTKVVIGRTNGKACFILKQIPITGRSYPIVLFLVTGYCDKMTLGFPQVQPTFSNANISASKIKPWFSHKALVEYLQLWNASYGTSK